MPGSAAAHRIRGALDKPGHTVIALAANGKAKAVLAKRGQFRLRTPAKRVTLHLRAPDGTYGGPVVVRRKGRRAIVGVRAGARLGRIDVRRGYARPVRRLPGRWVDPTQTVRARHGVPIGARVFGRVRSKPGDTEIPGDPDRAGGFRDSASDRPANPANTFSYKLDLTRCLDARGISFAPGDTVHVNFEAGPSSGDEASQTVTFTRQ